LTLLQSFEELDLRTAQDKTLQIEDRHDQIVTGARRWGSNPMTSFDLFNIDEVFALGFTI
jgi:hypothetical protein